MPYHDYTEYSEEQYEFEQRDGINNKKGQMFAGKKIDAATELFLSEMDFIERRGNLTSNNNDKNI